MRFRGDRYNALMLAALGVILVAILVYYFVFAPK